MSSGKVLLGVLAGVAVGATLGILFAPDKGTVTRKRISQKGDDYAEELQEKFSEFMESITKQFEAVKTEAVGMAKNGELKAEQALAEIGSVVNK